MHIKLWAGSKNKDKLKKIKGIHKVTKKNGGVNMSSRLLELKKRLQDNIYQATVIAEKNTKRNNLGQVVIPVGDEWRDEDCWDLYEKHEKKHN